MNKNYSSFFEAKKIALVGISSSPRKFGNTIGRTLRERGYDVFPIHPVIKQFDKKRCYEHLSSLPADVTTLVVSVTPDKAVGVVQEAVDSPLKRIWFQQGADFGRAAETARSAGMDVITDKCILLYAPPVTGFHAVHHFFARLFGRL